MSSVASVFCTVESYQQDLPLFATIWFEIISIIFIWYMLSNTRWTFTNIGKAFVVIPTLVIEDKSVNIVWLKWGVEIF